MSPPLDYLIQTKVRGKKITLTFHEKEVLRDDVTYLINFGQSVRDFRAGNILENFVFVFSTGDRLDSLSVSGTVKDFDTQKPIENTLVMMFDQLEDSCILKGKPIYFARTGKGGKFFMDYIKEGKYRVYACSDENGNFAYNAGKESIGFLSDDMVIDTNRTDIDIEVSKPGAPLKSIKWIHEYAHFISIVFNQALDYEPRVNVPSGVEYWKSVHSDSLRIWYETSVDSFELSVEEEKKYVFHKEKRFEKKPVLQLSENPIAGPGRDTIALTASIPISQTDFIETHFVRDTNGRELEHEIQIGEDRRKLHIIMEAEPDYDYEVILQRGLIEGINGELSDSIRILTRFTDTARLATFYLNLEGFDSTAHYEVFASMGKQKVVKQKLTGVDTGRIVYRNLNPGDLTIIIFEDRNNNGRWDAHHIFGRQQPEPRVNNTFKGLKPNIIREETIQWGN